MIASFGNKATELVFHGETSKDTRKLPPNLIATFQSKLDLINAAHEIQDLKVPPGNRLEKLKGDLKDFYSIRVNQQFCIIFKWVSHEAYAVEIIDYH